MAATQVSNPGYFYMLVSLSLDICLFLAIYFSLAVFLFPVIHLNGCLFWFSVAISVSPLVRIIQIVFFWFPSTPRHLWEFFAFLCPWYMCCALFRFDFMFVLSLSFCLCVCLSVRLSLSLIIRLSTMIIIVAGDVTEILV